MTSYLSRIEGRSDVVAHVSVSSYLVSMGRCMEVLLHDSNAPWGEYIVLPGVRRFEGPMDGGPYRLSLAHADGRRLLKGDGCNGYSDSISIAFEGVPTIRKRM